MKILYIITQGECGGAQKNVLDLAVGMRKLGNEVYVCTGRQTKKTDRWLTDKLKEQGFGEGRLLVLDSLRRNLDLYNDIKVFFDAYRLVKKIKPHIVHLHGSKAGTACSVSAKLAGASVVYTAHGFIFSERLSKVAKSFFVFSEFVASFFRDMTIAVSEYDKKIGERYRVVRGDKCIVVYNGLDKSKKDDIFGRDEARDRILEKTMIQNKTEIKLVGTVANFYKNKGLEYLIDAVRYIKNENVYFIVIGDGENRDRLLEQIKKNSVENKIFLVGSYEDAYKYLKAFDLILLPSIKEGLPYVLIESLLAGVPFIATKVGGVPEIARSNGLDLIPPGDSKAIAEAVDSFFQKDEVEKIVFPDIFNIDYMIDKVYGVYKNLLKPKVK